MKWSAKLTFNTLRLILHTNRIIMFVPINHFRAPTVFDCFPSCCRVQGLHDDHVAAIVALVEEAACCCVGLEGGHDFDYVAV